VNIPSAFTLVTPTEIECAKAKPAQFVVREFVRHAAILSLVLVISELVIPLQDTFQSPLRRVLFVAWWAAFMAGWKLWSGRRARQRAI
jgi:hypothetical protein